MSKVSSVVTQTTKAINKKGKLKGKNKKETKVLRAMCTHHRLNKHGKLKLTVFNENGYCVCTLCKKKFPAQFFEDSKIESIVDNMMELNNQNKFTAVSADGGEDTVKYFAQVGVSLSKYKKMAKKTKALAQKKDSVKKHKKNKEYGSDQYGNWESRK